MPRKPHQRKMDEAKDKEEALQGLATFLRGAPEGEDEPGSTELYEDRLAREAEEEKEEEKEEDPDNMQESKEPESDGMDGLRALPDITDEERTTTPVVGGRPGPPVPGVELTGAFNREEDNRQMDVVGNMDMSGFRTEFRRRLREPSGREGRIMKMMGEGGKAVKRKKR
tara:strand:+ start:749 stop:1255 length:507 start_codon:yes stop_codon:yes gene_type:complete